MALDTTTGNRKHRRARLHEVSKAERLKLLAVGAEFEHVVVRHHHQSYSDIYRRFLEAYVNTARSFNKSSRITEVDSYWFRNRYKANLRLRIRRWWNRVRTAARFNPLPA